MANYLVGHSFEINFSGGGGKVQMFRNATLA